MKPNRGATSPPSSTSPFAPTLPSPSFSLKEKETLCSPEAWRRLVALDAGTRLEMPAPVPAPLRPPAASAPAAAW